MPPRAAAWPRFKQWCKEELAAPWAHAAPPSSLRVRVLGFLALVGHPLSWFVWSVWLPQPYENPLLRIVGAALGLALISGPICDDPGSRLSRQVLAMILWLELPLFFSWMFLCNAGNAVWLASVAAMVLTYYFASDWRIATAGLALGALAARVLFEWAGPATPPWSPASFWADAVVIASCVGLGLLMGISSANVRRERIAHTLATLGIMAHEMRTPLATMALVGDAMRGCAGECDNPQARARLEYLAMRLHALVRNTNHQIDTQITNARIASLAARRETISAGEVVASALANYPFRSTREKECVLLQVHRDFTFDGSHALFSQVIDNLVKNALRALADTGAATRPGDIAIGVDVHRQSGRIVMADRGVGIAPELHSRILEPFFSTSRGTGHGLGLAFCDHVVRAARGTIRVQSQPGRGATFTIELPLSGQA